MRYIEGKAIGPSTVRTAARQAWGGLNSCLQMVPGVWAVDGWGHGGLLVAVGPSEPFQLDPTLATKQYKGSEWTLGGTPIVTFYQFEEDCDWADLIAVHPELLAPAIRKGYFSPDLTIEYVRERAADNRRSEVEAVERAAAIAANPMAYVRSASGDWKEGVPAGMVEVTTQAGTIVYVPVDVYRDHHHRDQLPAEYII